MKTFRKEKFQETPTVLCLLGFFTAVIFIMNLANRQVVVKCLEGHNLLERSYAYKVYIVSSRVHKKTFCEPDKETGFVGLLDIGRDMICWSRHISFKGHRAHIVRKNQKKLCFEKASLRVGKRQEVSLKIGERKSLKFSSYLQMTAF